LENWLLRSPSHLNREFQKVLQFNVFCVNHPIQNELAANIQDENTYLQLPTFYQQKRDYFLHLLKDSGFKITPSKGA
jgi:methionine aminotransferase